MFAVGGEHELSLASCFDAVLLHLAPHARLAHADALRYQVRPHLGPAVFLLDPDVDGPEMGRPVLLVSRYPGVIHFKTCADNAIAFPKMSRSVSSLATSACNRVSFICSGQTGWSPAPLSWPLLAMRTQVQSVCLGMPNVYAVTAAACPPLTDLTASNFNSRVCRACGFDSIISICPKTDFLPSAMKCVFREQGQSDDVKMAGQLRSRLQIATSYFFN